MRTAFSACRFCTARITSLSLPTPDGSISTRSGAKRSSTSPSARLKSPTKLQQMQPEFISVISMPASFKKAPSMPISPNSFSISTSFSPAKASAIIFLISVVLPAPRKPEKISIFVIVYTSFSFCTALSKIKHGAAVLKTKGGIKLLAAFADKPFDFCRLAAIKQEAHIGG